MPLRDIIDNRREKLVDHVNLILASSEALRFTVGYFLTHSRGGGIDGRDR
jgi:hypothetical protein